MNSVFEDYDVFLIDLFGVLWDGVQWIDGAKDTLKTLINNKKTVAILSNAAFGTTEEVIAKYEKLGLKQGEHFNFFITSGGVFRSMLQSEDEFISEKNKNNSYKYFVFGKHVSGVFSDTKYHETKNIHQADFVYVSIPQLTDEYKKTLPKDLQEMLYVSAMHDDGIIGWESDHVEPFMEKLQEILSFNKPLIVANPDKFAFCPIRESLESSKIIKKLLIRQGALGQAYIDIGGITKFIGKPYPKVYDFTLNTIKKDINITNKNFIMIGDTLETDILGAINATNNIGTQIDSVLVLSGVSANEMKHKHADLLSMNKFFDTQGIRPTHVMEDIKLDSKVLF